MGIDTRFWGPSGWDLFHRIAFHSKNPTNVLKNIAEVLPCKFCRKSTRKYVKENPYNANPGRWLYDIHNKVNDKLRSQCADDPKVINPGPDPSFKEVVAKYKTKPLTGIVGTDFLLSVAVNFTNTPTRLLIQKRFLKHLAEAYPEFNEYYTAHPPTFSKYSEWMQKFTGGSIAEVLTYKSRCKHGKTCRKTRGGGRRLTLRI